MCLWDFNESDHCEFKEMKLHEASFLENEAMKRQKA